MMLDNLPWIDEDGETIEEMSIAELAHELPTMLTWPTEPEVRAGDEFVFRWAKHTEVVDGEVFTKHFPDVYVKLTAHPIRHRKGYWQAPIVRVGFDRTEYMARGGGKTTNPLRAIDRDAPYEKVEKTPEQSRGEDRLRASRRLAAIKEAKGRVGPGTRARLIRQVGPVDDVA